MSDGKQARSCGAAPWLTTTPQPPQAGVRRAGVPPVIHLCGSARSPRVDAAGLVRAGGQSAASPSGAIAIAGNRSVVSWHIMPAPDDHPTCHTAGETMIARPPMSPRASAGAPPRTEWKGEARSPHPFPPRSNDSAPTAAATCADTPADSPCLRRSFRAATSRQSDPDHRCESRLRCSPRCAVDRSAGCRGS